MNLVNVLNEIKKQMDSAESQYIKDRKALEDTYKKKIEELQTAYKINEEMNTACLNCDGTGKEVYYDECDYESRSHRRTCSVCNGTGIKSQN